MRRSPPCAEPRPTRRCFGALLAESRAALPSARELRVDPRDADLALPLADGLGVESTLETWGGLELASDDGRTIRNTLEERLANAEPLLRRRSRRDCTGRPDAARLRLRQHAAARPPQHLLRGADYERLIGRDVDGLLGALATTPYAADAEASRAHDGLRRLHDAIRVHLSRSLEEMRSFYTGRARELVDVLLARFDLHNVIAVLRAHAADTARPSEARPALIDMGWLVEPLAHEILRQGELAGAVDLLARSRRTASRPRALRAAFAEYERTEDLAALEQRRRRRPRGARGRRARRRGRTPRRCCGSRAARSTSATF